MKEENQIHEVVIENDVCSHADCSKHTWQTYTHIYTNSPIFRTWSSMLFTPSGPSRSMAWPMRSVRPQLSIRKPKSRWNLSVAALESKRLKELKQHSGLIQTNRETERLNNQVTISDSLATGCLFSPVCWSKQTLFFATKKTTRVCFKHVILRGSLHEVSHIIVTEQSLLY